VKRLKVGINGFGRIGRVIFRLNQKYDLFDVVVINEINPDIANLAYLLRYDSVHGPFPASVAIVDGKLHAGDSAASVYHRDRILDVPWLEHGVEVLIDATASNENAAAITELLGAMGHYVTTHAAAKGRDMRTVVFGANENTFDPRRDRLISSSICDTIALAPLVRVLEDRYGIESGFLTTLHPWLQDQNLLDGHADRSKPWDGYDSHYALARSAVNNLIPKSTTAVQAADALFPGLSQKIEAFSYRVPTNIVSSAVLTVNLAQNADQRELIEMFYLFEKQQNWKIFNNSIEPKVSSDYCGNEFSVAIDHRWTTVRDGRKLRLVYWYDNEWGYSARVMDLIRLIGAG
jgi:glyceraldehyde 3-phosphate dehydrogenase